MIAQYCPFCGAPLGGINAAFCPRCGRQLPSAEPSATATAPSAPGAYAPLPPAPHLAPPPYAVPPVAVTLTPGRAGGATAAVAAITLVLSLLTVAPELRGLYGSGVWYNAAELTFISAWLLAGAFWLAIARLARHAFWRVLGECAALAFVGLLALPVLDRLDAWLLFRFDSPRLVFYRLLPVPPIKYAIFVVLAIALALCAAGLAWGFAPWRRLRAARVRVTPETSLILPVGATLGVYIASDVLIVFAERLVAGPLVGYMVALLLFDVLPIVVLTVAAGMITYTSLRDKLRHPALAPVAPPYPAAPPPGPR